MGAVIWLIENDDQIDISPGWNKQMAQWIWQCPHETRRIAWLSGEFDGIVYVLTAAAIPHLERFKDNQLKGVEPPPYDHSEHWTQCFERIIAKIRTSGEALVLVDW